jgi:hypothetical protein
VELSEQWAASFFRFEKQYAFADVALDAVEVGELQQRKRELMKRTVYFERRRQHRGISMEEVEEALEHELEVIHRTMGERSSGDR